MNSEPNGKSDPALAARIRTCAKKVGGGNDLARLSQIPRRTLEYYVTGTREPKASQLVSIAKAAGVDIGWLVSGEQPKTTAENQKAVPSQHTEFNRELFTDCWLAVTELLNGLNKELEMPDQIKLVFAVYDLQIIEQAEGQTRMNMAKVIQLVRRVA